MPHGFWREKEKTSLSPSFLSKRYQFPFKILIQPDLSRVSGIQAKTLTGYPTVKYPANLISGPNLRAITLSHVAKKFLELKLAICNAINSWSIYRMVSH